MNEILKTAVIQKIAGTFQNNLGNRITIELANGMIQEIAKLIPITEEPSNVDNTTTNSNIETEHHQSEGIDQRN